MNRTPKLFALLFAGLIAISPTSSETVGNTILAYPSNISIKYSLISAIAITGFYWIGKTLCARYQKAKVKKHRKLIILLKKAYENDQNSNKLTQSQVKLAKQLIQQLKNNNLLNKKALINESYSYTALQYAAVLNNKELILELLKNGTGINGTDPKPTYTNTNTPLCEALYKGYIDIAILLKTYGATTKPFDHMSSESLMWNDFTKKPQNNGELQINSCKKLLTMFTKQKQKQKVLAAIARAACYNTNYNLIKFLLKTGSPMVITEPFSTTRSIYKGISQDLDFKLNSLITIQKKKNSTDYDDWIKILTKEIVQIKRIIELVKSIENLEKSPPFATIKKNHT